MTAEERLKALGYDLPDLQTPPTHHNIRLYGVSTHVLPFRRVGQLLFTACIPTLGTKAYYQGTLGKDRSAKEGHEAARIAATSGLLGLRYAVKDLDRVEEIVRVYAFIICTPEFRELSYVARGVWDVFTSVLGPRGEHVNVPVGMPGIAGGHCLELVIVSRVMPE